MRSAPIIAALLAVTACGQSDEPLSEAEQQRIVSSVRAANETAPDLIEVTPEPILEADLERWDLYGQSCTYAPGTSLGARVIAREADAFIKLDGDLVRFAADPGSRQLPMRTRGLYNGREFSLRLEIASEGEQANIKTGPGNYEGTIWLRDPWDRVVYQGTGTVTCSE
jgi:hypothetical protein